MTVPKTIAITGASSGLGAALALEYASPGRTLFLSARSAQRLEDIKRECCSRGATVVWKQVDITKPEEIQKWIDEIESAAEIDLLIANAGIFAGHGKDKNLESADGLFDVVQTNLIGTMVTVNSVARHMKLRGQGHIALISSLASIQPLPDAPGYSASKAGITAFGDAMREYLTDYNVTLSIILPGHIKTSQTDSHIGPLAGIISAPQAARIIRRALDRKRTHIGVPKSMHFLVKLQRLLPWRLRALINRPQRFHVENKKSE